MQKIIILSVSMLLASNAIASNDMAEGKRLFHENCFVCHNADLDPPQAPPMYGVQKHYKRATADRDAFIEKVTAFATDPNEDKAILKMAVKHLGVMPNPGVEESDVRKIAAYIHNETFARPCGHMKAAMKKAKVEGDLKHFTKIKKNFNRKCAKQTVKAPAAKAATNSATAGSLKQIMQQ
ncbi:MAG: cytochrome c, partial [Mariprofundus sp.]|nr:cytochrome c [Mariprofundus sp.]